PANVTVPTGWAYAGCKKDTSTARLLTGTSHLLTTTILEPNAASGYSFTNSALTVESCISTCASRGFIYAGVEYANECYCGSGYATTAVAATTEKDCSMGCAGNPGELCGAGYRITLYTKTGPTVAALPAGWSPSMCAVDNSLRVLKGYQGTDKTGLTPASCIAKCASLNYVLAGVENGNECYCGNILTNNPVGARDVQCNAPCSGDASQNCGGNYRIMIYQKAS
ncbi:WSC domain-containing protein, partial [Mycena rosella]